MNKFRQSVLKSLDPDALDTPIVKFVMDQERRMAADPTIQAERKAIQRDTAREFLPVLAVVLLLVGALGYGAFSVFPVFPLPVMVGVPVWVGALLYLSVFGRPV